MVSIYRGRNFNHSVFQLMNYILFFVILWVSIPFASTAQDTPYLRVKGGVNPDKAVSANERYQYPKFLPGKLIFTNNSASTAQFNYNTLLGEMHFIDAKGDTLALANDPDIQLVTIGQDVFYYEYPKTYWLLLTDYNLGKLMVKRTMVLIDKEKQGGYNQSTGASSIRTTTSYATNNGSMARLNSQADLLFLKKDEYKLMDKNRKFFSANQSGILGLFLKNKAVIKQYLKETPIDFRQEADLKKVLEFCATLP